VPVIDYYYYGGSPFTYLGHRAFLDMAARHDATVNFKPVKLFELWALSGAVPPAKRPPVRQRYRRLELQRISEARSLQINLNPKHFPVDMSHADRAVIALVEAGHDPSGYMERVFSGVWVEDADLSDRDTIAGKLADSGFDADAILEAAEGPAVAGIYDGNTREAIAADAVGVPAYVLNGEVYWGQDRVEYLERALASGRPPFRAQ